MKQNNWTTSCTQSEAERARDTLIWLESVTEKETGNAQPGACVDVLPRCSSRLTEMCETPRQNVYACARLSISGLFFSHTFQSDQSLSRALGFILCAACGSVVLLYATRVFDYFVLIEIAFMDNQAQITETISRLDSEKVRW